MPHPIPAGSCGSSWSDQVTSCSWCNTCIALHIDRDHILGPAKSPLTELFCYYRDCKKSLTFQDVTSNYTRL